jgi:tetratricopeptide (TPR) repeat protein
LKVGRHNTSWALVKHSPGDQSLFYSAIGVLPGFMVKIARGNCWKQSSVGISDICIVIKAYFTNIRHEIISQLEKAESSVQVAVAWFTNNDLFELLVKKCESGLDVQLIIIADRINLKPLGLEFTRLIKAGGKLYFGNHDTLMHHKFCIIDSSLLISGSYNWTYWAEHRNNENVTISDIPELIQEFAEEFDKLTNAKEALTMEKLSSINPSTTNDMFNVDVINVEEYIGSAIDYLNRGNTAMSEQLMARAKSTNEAKVTQYFRREVERGNHAAETLYQNTVSYSKPHKTQTTQKESYESYCRRIRNLLNAGHYITAIEVSKECVALYPNRFTVHVLCGDAKINLGDRNGAYEEYHKALKYHPAKGATVVYYNKKYDHHYFPHADVHLKMGNVEMAKQVLTEAIEGFSKENLEKEAASARSYLNHLSSGGRIGQIS